jgi:hypothetical protein
VRTSKAAFLCVLCDKNLLVSSAAWRWLQGGGLDTLPAAGDGPAGLNVDAYRLALALGSLFATPVGTPSRLIVATLAQWLAERPDYQVSMGALANWADSAVALIDEAFGIGPEPVRAPVGQAGQHDGGDPVLSLWAQLDAEGRQLMAAAVLLLIALDTPTKTLRRSLPAPVAEIYDRLGEVIRKLPQIDEIRQQIRGPW